MALVAELILGDDSGGVTADETRGWTDHRAQPVSKLSGVMFLGGIENREIAMSYASAGHRRDGSLSPGIPGSWVLAESDTSPRTHQSLSSQPLISEVSLRFSDEVGTLGELSAVWSALAKRFRTLGTKCMPVLGNQADINQVPRDVRF
jgi:hypothetical protein